ncbi:MAG TPA: hypothetical protein VJ204_15195 [Solirubrobacterales bacterium]|nr:hypothetical protein [Solirubrobacterales bacterium]
MSLKVDKSKRTPGFWMGAFAAAMSLVAVAISLSGVATASQRVLVRKGDIAPGAVTPKSIQKGAVTTAKLQKGAVTSGKLGAGSVNAAALGNGSVTAAKLGTGSVTPPAIAPDAVTASAIAPRSVGATQLTEEEVVTKPIADLDKVAHNGEWTASNVEVAACGAGADLLGGGFTLLNPNNGESSWIQVLPIVNGETKAIAGRFVSDAGGVANGEIVALCLPK